MMTKMITTNLISYADIYSDPEMGKLWDLLGKFHFIEKQRRHECLKLKN